MTQSNLEKIGYSSESENIIIPSTFFDETDQKWYKVTSINYAFFMNKNLKNITIPVSLTSVGESAFLYTFLSNVYYRGNESQWNNINIVGDMNYRLTDASITYNYTGY